MCKHYLPIPFFLQIRLIINLNTKPYTIPILFSIFIIYTILFEILNVDIYTFTDMFGCNEY